MRQHCNSTYTLLLLLIVVLMAPATGFCQEIPAEYQAALKDLARTGDYKAGVLKVNIPRNDLKMTVAGAPLPTPFGFGGWVAMTKGEGGTEVMMGDLVLLQEEVNPVISELAAHHILVTALHSHMLTEQPRLFFMHFWAVGSPESAGAGIAAALKHVATR